MMRLIGIFYKHIFIGSITVMYIPNVLQTFVYKKLYTEQIKSDKIDIRAK